MGTGLHNTQQLPPKEAPVSQKKRSADSAIQSVQRAATILRSFTETEAELGVTALSERLGLHKSTVSRLLSTLQQEGFVEQDLETGKYRLGLGLVSLAGYALEHIDLRRVAQPFLAALAELTQETINVTVLDGSECVNIERVASPRLIRYVGSLGRRTPLHCTSTGKVLLAYMTTPEREAILPKKLTRYTDKTIIDRQVLEEVLVGVRAQGYAVAREEFEEDLTAMAVPICNHLGRVAATVSISGPTYRLEPEKLLSFVEPLRETARKISMQLGCPAGNGSANSD
jgi:DNA-binding IclR family transcriptional regulator